ncbi:carbohydrate ABC transporter permease [Streptomyces sp. CHA1]|uniref:carbohydrate ABC transporter permease n=1 Tax=Streptomyces TaxID=1883 RepID=UPI0003C2FB8E|nr:MULTISPECIES: carbohydrate ABC transporter permease [Streptomyces]QOZ99551.1 carbohydrate ABC transporter permease [Streptomyces violascens]ESQ00161.1 Sugar transport integral membrane protein [Streptomyces sp. GBA 94-10 4N24]ESQ06214.1 Sugar transport integral membrane protein [Streptomyces sp. PVA_94-07]MBP3077700.1 sugar ABC transporter permease [Streptomyces sp. 604F]MBT3159788.1 carbohydrate ABC transporter permease [Streptomyces sp. G11C]
MTTDSLPVRPPDTPVAPEPGRGPRPGPRRRRLSLRPSAGRQHHAGPLAYVLLGLASLLSLFPLYWTLVAASSDNTRVTQTPPPFLPGPHLLENLGKAWQDAALGKAMLNSLIVAGAVALSTVLFATLAGFAFAKLRFKGRNILLMLVIGTMMVPPQLGVVPLFMMMTELGWGQKLPAVIFPTLVSAVGVFFMRQYLAEALPDELVEAGRVDGAHSLRIFWSIVLPIARPAMAVLFMITFVHTWNDFFWPFIVLDMSNPTVPVALTQLSAGYVRDQSLIMAGALLGTLPLLALFVVFGRQIVGGIMQGAVKG